MTGQGRHAGGKASWGWAAEGAATTYIRRCCDMNSLKSECVVACVLRGYVEDTTVALDDCTTLNGISIWCSEGLYVGGGAALLFNSWQECVRV